jgi:hypothetical protein
MKWIRLAADLLWRRDAAQCDGLGEAFDVGGFGDRV